MSYDEPPLDSALGQDERYYGGQDYWNERIHMMYYRYVIFLTNGLARNAKSMLDVGSANTPIIEIFDWIPIRHTLDIKEPYQSDRVVGIQANFIEFSPSERYDFVTCFQVLEHIPDVEPFAKKLFEVGEHVLISVPYMWEAGSTDDHIHDPIDLEKLTSWTGRKPSYHIIVEEPLLTTPKRNRLICYYAPTEAIGLGDARRTAIVSNETNNNQIGVSVSDDYYSKQLRTLQTELEHAQHNLKSTNRLLDAVNRDYKNVEKKLISAQEKNEQTQEKLVASQEKNGQTQEKLVASQEKLESIKDELFNTKNSLNKLEITFQKLQDNYVNTQDILVNNQVNLHDTQTQLSQAQSYLAETQARLTETQAKLVETQNQLQETQTSLNNRKAEVSNLKKKLSTQQKNLEKTQRETAEATKKLALKEGRIRTVNSELNQQKVLYDAVLNSRTWRYTEFIRSGLNTIRNTLGVKSFREVAYLPLLPFRSREKAPAQNPEKMTYQMLTSTTSQTVAEDRVSKADDKKSASKPKAPKKQNIDPVELMRQAQPQNIEALKAETSAKGLDQVEDIFILYRIIGNDLYPRHKIGQSRENVEFILENESPLPNCEKRWIINRIINQKEEQAIVELLEKYGQSYVRIPFAMEDYKLQDWDFDCLPNPDLLINDELDPTTERMDRLITALYRHKNNYVMNNNGARNVALRDGKNHAKWILPWDGNCFLTLEAWTSIYNEVTQSPYLKYFAVPMTRVTDNALLKNNAFTPSPVEEPQLIFRSDAGEEFNEEFCYGRRPKVELFWRLGIPGKWDRWGFDEWDMKPLPPSPEANQFGVAGWVARLNSGMGSLEQDTTTSFKDRGLARQDAIIETLNYINKLSTGKYDALAFINHVSYSALEQEVSHLQSSQSPNQDLVGLVEGLIKDADQALSEGLFSVTDKTTLPPSNDPHDYWHPAPYWWPNPNTSSGLPYIQRDGIRVPGTNLYEAESDRYDRTRLQKVFDNSLILMLAWKFTGDIRYAEHVAKILERFFVNPETAMNPHLEYAQVRMGHNKNKGVSSGIIEMKDLYFYLDAISIVNTSGTIAPEVMERFKQWLSTYLDWLLTSKPGRKERKSVNNHGTFYDLQVASIANFLGNTRVLYETLIRSLTRIQNQFTADGLQPHEMTRTTTAHYCFFNLAGWIYIAEIGSRWGVDFWNYQAKNGANLRQAVHWLLPQVDQEWSYEQIDEFDQDRFYHAWFFVPEDVTAPLDSKAFPDSAYQVKPIFNPHFGIRPYWNIGERFTLKADK